MSLHRLSAFHGGAGRAAGMEAIAAAHNKPPAAQGDLSGVAELPAVPLKRVMNPKSKGASLPSEKTLVAPVPSAK